jgi:RHS repeat-associated protein
MAFVTTYSYDENGNRLSATNASGSSVGSYDAQDRVIQYGSAVYAYGANGDLRTKTIAAQTTGYDYDVSGALLAVTLPGGSSVSYLIDGKERRTGRIRRRRYCAGFRLPRRSEAGHGARRDTATSFHVSSNATRDNVPEYMVRSGVTYRLIVDHQGSPRLVVNVATGEIVQRIDYDEFGRVLTDTNPGFQPFGFAGGIMDHDTQLVRFGARDYDPLTGRWTAKDPVRFAGHDTNLYAYARNDPVNVRDPSGLWGIADSLGKEAQVLGYIACDGKDKIKTMLTDEGLKKTPQFQKCITAHEESHKADAYKAKPNVCQGQAAEQSSEPILIGSSAPRKIRRIPRRLSVYSASSGTARQRTRAKRLRSSSITKARATNPRRNALNANQCHWHDRQQTERLNRSIEATTDCASANSKPC